MTTKSLRALRRANTRACQAARRACCEELQAEKAFMADGLSGHSMWLEAAIQYRRARDAHVAARSAAIAAHTELRRREQARQDEILGVPADKRLAALTWHELGALLRRRAGDTAPISARAWAARVRILGNSSICSIISGAPAEARRRQEAAKMRAIEGEQAYFRKNAEDCRRTTLERAAQFGILGYTGEAE
ncbi:MAG: hypothetical protein HYZ29_25970 [Myxococcales bacterium]|nr:hypothetical protein [Myxococcales bacterium]